MLFFIFSGFVAFAVKPMSALCLFEFDPPRVVVRYGDSFSINCSTSVNNSEGMGWESPIGGVGLTMGVTSLILHAKASSWVINPVCYFNLLDGEQCTQHLPVTVYKEADSLLISQPDTMVEGQKYHMQCEVANVAPAQRLTMHWHKGHQTYMESFHKESVASPLNLTSYFNLTANRDDNGALIWCEAKQDFGPLGPRLPVLKSKLYKMNVLYAPTFSESEKEMVTLQPGRETYLNCTATGNPMPLYRWYRPRDMLKEKDKDLPILTTSYPGTYNCTASNSQGNKTKSFIVVEAPRNYTTIFALLGAFLALAILIAIAGFKFLTPHGTFSCNKRQSPPTSGVI